MANGEVDTTTRVVYLQTANRYADIRVAADRPDFSHRKSLRDCTWAELSELGEVLADYGVCEVTRAPDDEPGLLTDPLPRSSFADAKTKQFAQAPLADYQKSFVPLSSHYCFATETECTSSADLTQHINASLAFDRWREGLPASAEWIYSEHDVARWHAETNYQPVAFYPEPGLLELRPDRLLEIAPSRAYREDWRALRGSLATRCGQNTFASLRLVEERGQHTGGEWRSRRGGLLICGDHAVVIRDRWTPSPTRAPLVEVIAGLRGSSDRASAEALLDCEYTYLQRRPLSNDSGVGTRNEHEPFVVQLSTLPFEEDGGYREGASVSLTFPGPEWIPNCSEVGTGCNTPYHFTQIVADGMIERRWAVEDMPQC